VINETSCSSRPEKDTEAAVADFIRTRGATRCPTACVLPTQASIAAADKAALEQYVLRRAALRQARRAARMRLWDWDRLNPAPR
jgi:hypothetical protein